VLRVSAAEEVTDELLGAVHRLLPQLSSSARFPNGAEIGEIVASRATTLLVARDDGGPATSDGPGEHVEHPEHVDPGEPDGRIVGMLTLVTFRIPTGVRAWIEDVVVDNAAGRRGIGTALMEAALELARSQGAGTVDLTSRPSREAANHMYQKVGFELRQTNVYRYRLGPSGS
jgi:ribosomal protein S18 acetylase RimI-like enzyme